MVRPCRSWASVLHSILSRPGNGASLGGDDDLARGGVRPTRCTGEMAVPRCVVRGKTLFVSRRCSERRFFLRPCRATRSTVVYLVAEAAERYGVMVHALCVLSNHLLCAAAHNRCYGQRLVMRICRPRVV